MTKKAGVYPLLFLSLEHKMTAGTGMTVIFGELD